MRWSKNTCRPRSVDIHTFNSDNFNPQIISDWLKHHDDVKTRVLYYGCRYMCQRIMNVWISKCGLKHSCIFCFHLYWWPQTQQPHQYVYFRPAKHVCLISIIIDCSLLLRLHLTFLSILLLLLLLVHLLISVTFHLPWRSIIIKSKRSKNRTACKWDSCVNGTVWISPETTTYNFIKVIDITLGYQTLQKWRPTHSILTALGSWDPMWGEPFCLLVKKRVDQGL